MARPKSDEARIDVPIPFGGINRATPFVNQPKGTVRDAVNFWPQLPDPTIQSTIKGRYAVGIRPGVGLAYQQTFNTGGLFDRVVFFDRVIVGNQSALYFTDDFNTGSDGEFLHSPWTPVPWIAGLNAPQYNGLGQVFVTDGNNRAVYLNHLDYDPTIPYTIRLSCLKDGHYQRGTYRIYLQLNNGSPDATDAGVVISVTMEDQNGNWSTQIDHRIGGGAHAPGSPWTNSGTTSTSADDDFDIVVTITQHVTTFLTLTLDFATATNTTVRNFLDIGATDPDEGKVLGFGMENSTHLDNEDHDCLVDQYQIEYYSAAVQQTQGRSYFVTSATGTLWVQLDPNEYTWSWVDTKKAISENKMIQTTERYGILYIADYDEPLAIGAGTGLVSSSNRFDSSVINDFGALGIDTETDKIILTDASTPTANGVYKIDWVVTDRVVNIMYKELTDDVATITIDSTDPIAVGSNVTVALTTPDAVFDGTYQVTASSALGQTFSYARVNADVPVTSAAGVATQAGNYLILNPNPGNTASASYRIQKAPLKYTGSTNLLSYYTADPNKGDVPLGCNVIAQYDGRIVMGGYPYHAVFMSRQGDPNDWDYGETDPQAAIALTPPDGTRSVAGEVTHQVTQLIPIQNNYLVVGCKSAIWLVRGNPALLNPVTWISETIGMVPGKSWCIVPNEGIYFLSTNGLYVLPFSSLQEPVPISKGPLPYDLLFKDEDRFTMFALLAYDKRYRCVMIWKYNEDAQTSDDWIYHLPTKSMWRNEWLIEAGDQGSRPTCINQFDDYWTDQSAVIMGCADGRVRCFRDNFIQDDDNVADPDAQFVITGNVLYGPFSWDAWSDVELTEVLVNMADGSRQVSFEVFGGDTAEEAYDAYEAGTESFTWDTDTARKMQVYEYPKVRARWIYINLVANEADGPGFAAAEEILLTLVKCNIWRPN